MNYTEIMQLKEYGLTIEQVKRLATYKKGKLVSITQGSNTINVQIPGNAKALMGLSLIFSEPFDDIDTQAQLNLKLNNDTVLDTMDLTQFYVTANGLQPNGYVECFRTMQGADVLELVVQSQEAFTCVFMFHYVGNSSQNWLQI
jgi:hypothetical protein